MKTAMLKAAEGLFRSKRSLSMSLLLVLTPAGYDVMAADLVMVSPGSEVSATLTLGEEGALKYSVNFKGAIVVEPSAIGIGVDGVNLGEGVTLDEPEKKEVDETYATRGNHTEARNHFNQWSIPVKHQQSGRSYSLQFRLYDDGVAYRYLVPGEGTQHVDGESSSWKLMADSRVWYFERLNPGWKLKSYAGEWMSTSIEELDTATPARVGPVQGPPLVLKLPNDIGYAAVTKAALYNYSGMRLNAVGDRTVVADFTEGKAGFDVEGDIVTPWRATMLADDLNELVNSDFINNLNPAPDPDLFADTSYIVPGRSVWSWETLGLDTPDTQRNFIDLASEIGYEYTTVDDGWKDWDKPWETVRDLVKHGESKGVKVFVWVHSKDIRDPADNYRQLRDYLDRIAEAGVVGIKTDFMDAETKAMVDFEIATLREAAKRKLLINFHGVHASTGEERTYPNEVTREGIRGMELNKLREGPLPASHNAALPFTRFVVGHGDYTPIIYTNPGPTTLTHQLAALVNFNSALQTVAEHPGTMMKAPAVREALALTQAVPTVWDETRVLSGSEIGDLAVMARRKGEEWFVGIINGAGSRDYQLDLGFLSDGEYETTMVRDDEEADPVDVAKIGVNQKAKLRQWTTTVAMKVEVQSLNCSQKLNLHLSEGGGFVARFVKK